MDTSGKALPSGDCRSAVLLVIEARPRDLILRGIEVKMAEIQNDPVASVIEDLYPLAQVAKILRCSRKSVYRLISSAEAAVVKEAFVDTLYFVALFNPRDQWHDHAIAASKLIADTKLITTEDVLVELLNFFSEYGEKARRGVYRKMR